MGLKAYYEVVVDGRRVAYASLSVVSFHGEVNPPQCALLDLFAVDPKFRRQGFGSVLMSDMCRDADEAGWQLLALPRLKAVPTKEYGGLTRDLAEREHPLGLDAARPFLKKFDFVESDEREGWFLRTPKA